MEKRENNRKLSKERVYDQLMEQIRDICHYEGLTEEDFIEIRRQALKDRNLTEFLEENNRNRQKT